MTLRLYVDGDRWRRHLRDVAASRPGLVPVAKGNGYGFGLASLARRTQWLGCPMIAVGTYGEVAEVADRFAGVVLVLEPWRPTTDTAVYGKRIVHTIAREGDLRDLAARAERPRVVLEGLTSMRRHGMAPAELSDALHPRGVSVVGCALHLPLGGGYQSEVESWVEVAPHQTWFVSHLTRTEHDKLLDSRPGLVLRPRIGTELWLGEPGALSCRATVLDVHSVRRGDRIGYRQHKVPHDGSVLVVAGGTSHGIGLEAPPATAAQRARALARGGLDALGRTLSPFVVAGRKRWFAEPPHMHVSMVLLPDDVAPPEIGDEVEARIRATTTTFDEVRIT